MVATAGEGGRTDRTHGREVAAHGCQGSLASCRGVEEGHDHRLWRYAGVECRRSVGRLVGEAAGHRGLVPAPQTSTTALIDRCGHSLRSATGLAGLGC